MRAAPNNLPTLNLMHCNNLGLSRFAMAKERLFCNVIVLLGMILRRIFCFMIMIDIGGVVIGLVPIINQEAVFAARVECARRSSSPPCAPLPPTSAAPPPRAQRKCEPSIIYLSPITHHDRSQVKFSLSLLSLCMRCEI